MPDAYDFPAFPPAASIDLHPPALPPTDVPTLPPSSTAAVIPAPPLPPSQLVPIPSGPLSDVSHTYHSPGTLPVMRITKRRNVAHPMTNESIPVATQISTRGSHDFNSLSVTNPITQQPMTATIEDLYMMKLKADAGHDPTVPLGKMPLPSGASSMVLSSAAVMNTTMDDTVHQILTPLFGDHSPSTFLGDSEHVALSAIWRASSFIAKQQLLPSSLQDVYDSDDRKDWLTACNEELAAFRSHDTYDLVSLPSDRKALGSRWVFTVKDSGRKKARLVAQGFRQKEGIDYTETFAPVIRYESCRIFLALAVACSLRVYQFDVDTAFLNSKIDTDVYVRQPPGYINSKHPDWVWKLKGGMYGLKQAPLLWNEHINARLLSFGFIRHPGESGLYFHHAPDGLVLLGLYVDDILVAAPSPRTLHYVRAKLFAAYSIKDIGPVSKFLGLNIRQLDSGEIHLSLHDYITSAAVATGIPLHQSPPTPLSPSTDYQSTESPLLENVTEYQSIVGQLIFVANTGRPDIAFTVSLLARFLKNPRAVHLSGARRTLGYLYATRYQGLAYRKDAADSSSITMFSDASHGSAVDMPHSTGGYLTLMTGAPVTWSSKKIKSAVNLSSTEAEYIALSEASKEAIWLKNLLEYMKISVPKTPLWVDNAPAIDLAKTLKFATSVKQVDLRYHMVRDTVKKGIVELRFVPTKEQAADILTKILPRPTFSYLCEKLLTMLSWTNDS